MAAPCFYAFFDYATGLFWMVPISSQIKKFKAIYQRKISKYGRCDTISFGYVLGHEKAFLFQNMCPVSPAYIASEYIDSRTNTPVRIDRTLEAELSKKARKVLALHRRGVKLIFPDVSSIEAGLSRFNEQTEHAFAEGDAILSDPNAKRFSSVEALFEDLETE